MDESSFSLFDALRIVRFPDGASEVPVYYSRTGRTHLRIGDVGVVIALWSGNTLRCEAVAPSGAIDWQHHLQPDQVERIPITEAPYCRRRINESWAWYLGLNETEFSPDSTRDSLNLARKVMTFARRNVETLVNRLVAENYQFANSRPFNPPAKEVLDQLAALAEAGVHVPIAMQAWLLEVGSVDLCGTHPDWPRSAWGHQEDGGQDFEPWYSDPLVIDVDLPAFVKQAADDPEEITSIDFAPDAVTKACISGGGPISVACVHPAFDNVLIGQHGSFTLLSYLNHAFAWAGFPGFCYIADAPVEHLRLLAKDLVRL